MMVTLRATKVCLMSKWATARASAYASATARASALASVTVVMSALASASVVITPAPPRPLVLSFLRPRAVFGFVKYYVVLHEDSQGGKALAEYPLHCNRSIHDRRKVALHSRLGDDERGLGHTRRFRMVACSSPEETSLTHVSKRHRHTLMILGDDK